MPESDSSVAIETAASGYTYITEQEGITPMHNNKTTASIMQNKTTKKRDHLSLVMFAEDVTNLSAREIACSQEEAPLLAFNKNYYSLFTRLKRSIEFDLACRNFAVF